MMVPVATVTCPVLLDLARADSFLPVGIAARNVVSFTSICRDGDGTLRWEQVAAPEVRSDILAMAMTAKPVVVAATGLGIVAFDLP
jgi:hypothetical protein